jgi:3-methyladenine DNA glycosylase Mpg
MAMGIALADYGADVTRGRLVVREPGLPQAIEIDVTPRIGIRVCAERPLRFVLRGNRFVSGPR